eukprot:CAMPEP_0197196170 /NCGR_PEP_ID=MMETSP1423-20130617/32213_1 /TAXON_ID=476441 /ORGANISM="Pseudo-nitzschia heimii, Strain UNC1101" /LENGTH=497 /DNA_ID=CAMNT_0042649949 /DNA_START=260 /DNA_END=1753 /DNA_ORIENTATION=-
MTTLPSYASNDEYPKTKDKIQWSPLLYMQQSGLNEENKNSISLSAFAPELSDYDSSRSSTIQTEIIDGSNVDTIPDLSVLDSFIIPVLTASLMVTGNTVGAGMLVIPEVLSGPGPLLSFGIMLGVWIMCLTSGLAIAQVAIQEHESSGTEVPSSFKEFAEATLPSAANLVSGTSVFINTLIVAFDVFKAGEIGRSLLPSEIPIDGTFLSYIYSGLLVALVSSQSLNTLSQVASILVMGLFATFAGLLLPGLANVIDPTSVLFLPPRLPSEEIGDGVLLMTPVVISVLVFQNIVPTITRLLDYDRLKIVTALGFGSFIPLVMYIAWGISVLGGGIDPSSTSSASVGALLTCFSLITVAGSTLGGSMSLSEEFEIFLGPLSQGDEENKKRNKDATFSLPSVAMPIGIALVLAQVFSSNITETLKIAGAFGSPILYGFIPVSMALMQNRQTDLDSKSIATSAVTIPDSQNFNIIPGGNFGLGVLSLASAALIGTEFVQQF